MFPIKVWSIDEVIALRCNGPILIAFGTHGRYSFAAVSWIEIVGFAISVLGLPSALLGLWDLLLKENGFGLLI